MGEGAREEGSEKNVSHAPLPHRSFFILGSAFAWLNILFYEPQIKRKNSQKKNCQLRGLVVQLLHLAGHCLRQPNKIVSKLVLWQLSVGRVSRGRQPIDSYIDNIKRDTSLHSISEIRSAMLDRNVWKDFVMKARSIDRPK